MAIGYMDQKGQAHNEWFVQQFKRYSINIMLIYKIRKI